MRPILFIILIAGIALSADAQVIRGRLADPATNQPISGANIVLKSIRDSTITFQTSSDTAGAFRINRVSTGQYNLRVSFIGYEEYLQPVSVSDTSRFINLGVLSIPKTSVQLRGVTVVSNQPPVRLKGDTSEYSASQYKVNPDATTEDLIKKMPGITVAKDGTVTAQGEQVRKVTVDGRDFFGDDATAALRNLPSEVIDKIQVFDRLSDQAQFTGVDDGNSVKALNIVTKSGLRNGQFGRVYAGAGTDNRYAAGGNVSFFSGNRRLSLVGNFNNVNQQNFGSQDLLGITSRGGGRGGRGGGNRGGAGENFQVGQQNGISTTNAVGVNYSDKWGKKLDMSGSYFFNNSTNVNDKISRTETKLADGRTLFYNQISNSQSKNYNHRFNLRMMYKIDSNNTIIITPSLNFQKNESISGASENSLYGINDSLNTSSGTRLVLKNGYNLRNNIFYWHAFAKRGRTISAGFNTTFSKNDGETFSNSHYRFFESGGIRDSLQDQFSDNPTNGYDISANLVYTEPLNTKSQLQINYSPSYSKNNANQETFEYDAAGGKYNVFKEALSNKFDNITTTQNGGITYRLGTSRDNQFTIGINLQSSRLESERIFPSHASVDQRFTNLLPNLMWRRKLSEKSNLRIFYRASTSFPSVSQLQDVVNNTNELQKSTGNPELKQSYNHIVASRYQFSDTRKGQSFFANIFFQSQQDYITNATFIAQADSVLQQGTLLKKGAQLVKPVNMDGYKSLRSFFTFSQPVKPIKSSINLSTGFSYVRLPGLINNVATVTDNFIYSGGLVVASNLSQYVDFNVSYNINYNNAKTSISGDNNYLNQATGITANFLTKSGWFLLNDLSNQRYTGLSDGFNQDYWLWNAGIGKKFLKSKAGELKLSVFDLLKQNQSISREVTANYIEDVQSRVLQQYFMLTFTYNVKNFGKGTPAMMGPGRGRPDRNF